MPIIIINTRVFATKIAALQHYRAILYRRPPGCVIPPPDHDDLLALLDRHPSAAEKIGSGVASFTVEQNHPYPTFGFWLTRIDGSRTDWSFRECLTESPHPKKIKAVFRELIQNQIAAFRRQTFTGTNPLCPITNVVLTNSPETHVDHVIPFEDLVADFLLYHQLAFADIHLQPTTDGETRDLLIDTQIGRNWQDYHQLHARLRCVSKRANLSLLRRQSGAR